VLHAPAAQHHIRTSAGALDANTFADANATASYDGRFAF
jgi:hypothetical protein